MSGGLAHVRGLIDDAGGLHNCGIHSKFLRCGNARAVNKAATGGSHWMPGGPRVRQEPRAERSPQHRHGKALLHWN